MRLIYFAPVPFATYGQRPHFLTRAMTEVWSGAEVLWVDPYPTRWPRLSDLRRTRQQSGTAMATWPGLRVVKPLALPLEPLPGAGWLNGVTAWRNLRRRLLAFADEATVIGIGRPSKLACWALATLPARVRYFDAMDDFPAFYGGWSRKTYAATEQEVAESCDLIACSSEALLQKWRRRLPGRAVESLPNGYHMQALPPFVQHAPSNRIGFVGTMAGWFDWHLVCEMAQALPEAEFVLAGPAFGAPPRLPDNIRCLPPCPVEAAVGLMAGCVAGIIPFLRISLTEAVDPVKYYEMRGLGLPVWTTSFGAMEGRIGQPGVWGMAGGADWQELWKNTLAWREDVASIDVFRRNHDWRQRAERLCAILDSMSLSR